MSEVVGRTLPDLLATWHKEIQGYLEEMCLFKTMDPLEIMKLLSSYSARASFIRNQLVRSTNKQAETFRIKEIDPFLTEVDRQFKVWSRIAAVIATEWDISRGGH
jgi:hypothetical protein